jgi:hypothetical protein
MRGIAMVNEHKEGYSWSSLSQWDQPPKDAIIRTRDVGEGPIKTYCRFMLVEKTDTGYGYLRSKYVPKCAVNVEILRLAGEW